MPLILPGSAPAPVAYDIANSCRFNDGDAGHLHFTPSSEGDRTEWTLSLWFKRGTNFGAEQRLFGGVGAGTHLFLNTSDQLKIGLETDSGDKLLLTNRLFRDPSAWYHVVIAYDSNAAASGNRIRMYINGTEETSFSAETQPSSGEDSAVVSDDSKHDIGYRIATTSMAFDGYMAEIVLIDGDQLTASSFGEFDSRSPTIWKPKDVSGLTFGSQGYHLDFENSAALGNDVSGNDNDWTVVSLAATDQATDTPTNNFCTLNPLSMYHSNTPTLAQGNCRFSGTAAGEYGVTGTMGVSSGKWYFEMKKVSQDAGPDDDSQRNVFGITAKPYRDQATHPDPESWMLLGNSVISNNSTTYASVGASMLSDGGILQCALDLDNNRVAFGHDDAWQTGSSAFSGSYSDYESITAAASTISGFYFPIIGDNSSSRGYTMDANFGGCPPNAIASAATDENGYGTFEFAPPTGFLALCTKNLGSDGG